MIQFNAKSKGGSIEPLEDSKKKFFAKVLDNYERENKTFRVTIEPVTKNINDNQVGLYRAFILKSADHFGNTFKEMENILTRFHPTYPMDENFNVKLPISRWSSKQLDDFITKSTAFLAEHGFNF